jgi:hypothetical protein
MSLTLEPPSCPFLSLKGSHTPHDRRRSADAFAFHPDSFDPGPLQGALCLSLLAGRAVPGAFLSLNKDA